MKKAGFCAVALAAIMCVILVGCGIKGEKKTVDSSDYQKLIESMKAGDYSIDFETAESFEAAINDGEDILGKVVKFTVSSIHPDSALGYTLWAGEHLNFVGEVAEDVGEGDTVIAVVNSIQDVVGSWAIGYDILNVEPSNGTEYHVEPEKDETTASDSIEPESQEEESQTTEPVNNQPEGSGSQTIENTSVPQLSEDTSLIEGLDALGYSKEETNAIATILANVGIPKVDDMWNINKNGTLQANACTYKNHQINFTTDNGECFYVQITGWKEEISSYGWYRSAWSGKLKYGYNTQTKINTVDLYATDYDNTGYLAVYDAETDSVKPYEE